MSIDEALKVTIDAHDLRLTEIATAAEVSEQTVRGWTSGAVMPSGDRVLRLMNRLPSTFRRSLGFELIVAEAVA